MENKNLFFGFEITVPWPEFLPTEKRLSEENRHITLIFLGKQSKSLFSPILDSLPLPLFQLAPVGLLDSLLFFPEESPRLIAYHVRFLEQGEEILSYKNQLEEHLKEIGIKIQEQQPFLPHLTISRSVKERSLWESGFSALPFVVKKMHLYEAQGQLTYQPVWSHLFQPPFEELDHTADIAYRIYGTSFYDLYHHAAIALAFSFKEILTFYELDYRPTSLDELVRALNRAVSLMDREIGSPLKAVSYHGRIVKTNNNLLSWEMIIDV